MMLTSDELAELIEGLAGLPYGGEAVDQRRHALQCAGHAVAAGSDDELVLAAALHDIGRAEPVRAEFPGLPHEQAGEAFARDRVGAVVAWLIGQHVPAKRYLVAVDQAYFGQLSPASVRSLERQGGPMNPAEVEQFRSHPRAGGTKRRRTRKTPACPWRNCSAYSTATGWPGATRSRRAAGEPRGPVPVLPALLRHRSQSSLAGSPGTSLVRCAGCEAVEDDGEQPRPRLLIEAAAGGGVRKAGEQGVDPGQFDVVADGSGLLGTPEQRADGPAQPFRCPHDAAVAVAARVEQGPGYGHLRAPRPRRRDRQLPRLPRPSRVGPGRRPARRALRGSRRSGCCSRGEGGLSS